ncbi:MAG TPA: tRNA (adenosine(37)-N6)-threonylcarbamoyltransferase complex transferase subunit TsaD [Gammaproteobacteria bacterium]
MVKVLGIETSCDETGVAVYASGRGLLAEALFSQVEIHKPFGGVVPELASRDHAARLAPMIRAVVGEAQITLEDLDAVAYAAGPGLIGALMVGASLGASLALALAIPAVPVHHMEAHLLAAMLETPRPEFPFIALLVSGGHTQLVRVRGHGDYETLGNTLDDAAGEAFDKVARLLSLPYPGGPALAALAERGDAAAFAFPRPLKSRGLDMSFSGLKTAVRLELEKRRGGDGVAPSPSLHADVAASFQAAVVDTLVTKCLRAVDETGIRQLVIAGGVGANTALREELRLQGERHGIVVHYPRPGLCTDNGAMIAYAGWCRLGDAARESPRIVARPRWPLDELRPVGNG